MWIVLAQLVLLTEINVETIQIKNNALWPVYICLSFDIYILVFISTYISLSFGTYIYILYLYFGICIYTSMSFDIYILVFIYEQSGNSHLLMEILAEIFSPGRNSGLSPHSWPSV